jgi:hypothetical protein
VENQSNLVSIANLEVLKYLKSLNNPTNISLTTNCRNTKNILTKVQQSLGLDMGNNGTGMGPDVFEVALSGEPLVKALEDKIVEILKQDVYPGAITVLSSVSFDKSIVNSLSDNIKSLIVELDDYSVRNFPPSYISFSEIRNFKGLENEVILLVDLPKPSSLSGSSDKAQHYVGMSRARGLLCAFWSV